MERIMPTGEGEIRSEGAKISREVEQLCAKTLGPVPGMLSEKIEVASYPIKDGGPSIFGKGTASEAEHNVKVKTVVSALGNVVAKFEQILRE